MRTKLLFVFLLLIGSINLSAQFNEPILVNADSSAQFAGQQAYKIVGNKIYLTFIQSDGTDYGKVVFAYSENNGQEFTYTIVDTMGEYCYKLPVISNPVLETISNEDVIIFYTKAISDSNFLLYKAISTDNGETFTKESIAENVFETPYVINHNDTLELCYSTGFGEEFTNYQYFTDIEESENADAGGSAAIVKFYGFDELWGPVHSNDDIWIQNAVGGWPTFHGFATTSGRIMDYSTFQPAVYSAPMSVIFLGGYQEEVPPKTFGPGASLIRLYGIRPFAGIDADIVYVKINGSAFCSILGFKELVGIDSFKVYSWYPADAEQANAVINAGGNWFEDADHIWTNYIPIYETNWITGPSGFLNNQSVWVGESKLWIEGEVAGKQTWGCADTVFIVGDITYQNTVPGQPPDDPDNPNPTDYFGLVSEKKILVSYKFRDPFNNMEIDDDNCWDVYLYGAYAAIGIGDTTLYGDMACHYDGIFTFQYQHPHGSTPSFTGLSPYTLQDTLYTYIDFHKYIYPPDSCIAPNILGFNLHGGAPQFTYWMCGYPYEAPGYLASYPNTGPGYVYPYGTDWPWYNPVWPESAVDIVTERGAIRMFGSLTQRRRGFVHRSGFDPYNHPDGDQNPSEWDIENYHYDGCHPSTGYNKDYHYDTRLLEAQLPDFPSAYLLGIEPTLFLARSTDEGANFEIQYEQVIPYPFKNKSLDTDNNLIIFAYQNFPSMITIMLSDNGGESYQEYEVSLTQYSYEIYLRNIKIYDDEIYILTRDGEEDLIIKYDYQTHTTQILTSFTPQDHLSDFAISNTGEKLYTNLDFYESPYQFHFHYAVDSDEFTEYYNWLPGITWEELNPISSQVALNFDEYDSVYVGFLKVDSDDIDWGDLYLASGYLESVTPITEGELITPNFLIRNYPNPLNLTTKIHYSIPKDSRVELSVYNIKGQLVKTLVKGKQEKGGWNIVWDGKDGNGNPVSSGIYFYQLQIDNKIIDTKKCLVLK
ncbi:MAG: T9SS type A sorting domain-containing protein [Candidatus Cloacimonetes bacterium]|nr:T9SS type A sorting domain-containing protein [Candidatus Cloacimonadota bacterium]